MANLGKDCFGATPKPTRETRALPRLSGNDREWPHHVVVLMLDDMTVKT